MPVHSSHHTSYVAHVSNMECPCSEVRSGVQKSKGKKVLAAAAPPPKPSVNVIAPPAPRSGQCGLLLHFVAGNTFTFCLHR